MKINNLKEKQIIEIERKKFEIVGIQGEGRKHEKTGEVRNCKNYILHEVGSKFIEPQTSLTYCADTNRAYWGFSNKEIKLKDIRIK